MPGVKPITYTRYLSGRMKYTQGFVVEEIPLCLRVEGRPWVTLMCSPHDLEDLVLGFLRAEEVIMSPEDVQGLEWKEDPWCVDVHLSHPLEQLPERLTLTTGCTGGVTFADLAAALTPLESSMAVSPERIIHRMRDLLRSSPLYRQARGIHSAALSDGETLLVHVEDVGRHNTLDRLWGRAMREQIETRERLIFTTGRISVEMLHKATRMGVPIVASRTSPTSMALDLAQAWGVTVIGYVRPYGFRVYTHPERIHPE